MPPEWISKPKDAEAVEGEDVFFPCSVSGVPEPLITWRKMAGEGNILLKPSFSLYTKFVEYTGPVCRMSHRKWRD